MLQFQGVELFVQSCDSSMDQGERARVERCIAVGHLQNTIGLKNKILGGNERFT